MKKLLLFVAIAIFLSACEDKNTPEPTPDPKPYVNKFNCKINGRYWEVIPKEISELNGQGNTLFAEFQFKDSILWISAINQKENDNVVLRIPFYLKQDTLSNISKGPYSKNKNNDCGYSYLLVPNTTNYVIITEKDNTRKVLKGVFEFTTKAKECNDTIKITEGYFDYNFK